MTLGLVKELAQDHMLKWSSWNLNAVGTGFRATALHSPLEGPLEGMGLPLSLQEEEGPFGRRNGASKCVEGGPSMTHQGSGKSSVPWGAA